jgi:hypothetical protein
MELAMQFMWTVTIEDILEAQTLARKRGKKAGESYEVEFLEVMAKKGQKPACATELTHNEILAQYAEKDKTILDVSHNSQGEQTLRVIKKNDNME